MNIVARVNRSEVEFEKFSECFNDVAKESEGGSGRNLESTTRNPIYIFSDK